MSVKIGNLQLEDTLRLLGLEESDDIHIQVFRFLGGETDVQTMEASETGRELTLTTGTEQNPCGSITLGQLHTIKSIARSGLPVVLEHPRGIFNVLVKGVLNPVPRIDYVNPDDDDEYFCQIKMIEV